MWMYHLIINSFKMCSNLFMIILILFLRQEKKMKRRNKISIIFFNFNKVFKVSIGKKENKNNNKNNNVI